jgi:hypothetical protein
MAGARVITGVHGLQERPPSWTLLRRLTLAFVCLWAASALWSGYRAVVQIFRLEFDPVGGVLRGGSTVRARVVTSGRTRARVRLEPTLRGRPGRAPRSRHGRVVGEPASDSDGSCPVSFQRRAFAVGTASAAAHSR